MRRIRHIPSGDGLKLVPTNDLIRELALRSPGMVIIRERFCKPGEAPLQLLTSTRVELQRDTDECARDLIRWAIETMDDEPLPPVEL